MTAENLRKAILQQAIQGKLVPQDPNDEPASVLLERIREEKARLVKEKKIKKDKYESIIYRGEDNFHYEKILATGEVKCIDDEIPFEIPESWCWSRFSNIVNLNPNVQTEDDNDVAFMPMAYIEAGYSGEYTYEVKKWTEVKKGFTKISKGDIAYAKITPCFQNRKSFILEDVPSNVAAATTELNVLRIYENTLSAWFVLFFLKTDYFIKEAKLKGTAGQQRVIPEYVQNKLFPIAPLSEQNRIVSRIKELLTIIERYEQSKIELDKLESELQPQLKKSILQYAIQGKLVAQNPKDEPASELLKRINEEKEQLIKDGKIKREKNTSIIFKGDDNKYYEKLGGKTTEITEEIPYELPNNWVFVRLANLCWLDDGYKASGEKLPYMDAKYHRGKSEITYLTQGKVVEPPCKAILVDGENSGEIFNITEKGYLGSTFKILQISKCISEEWLHILLNTYRDLFKNSKVGAAIPHLNKNIFRNLIVGIPPIEEQQRITDRIEKLMKGIEGI